MRRFLLALFILGCSATAGAQSINLLNLTSLVSLSNKQAADDFSIGKVFKLKSKEEIGGVGIDTYQTTAARNKVETVVVGKSFKAANGGVLHTVSYISANSQDVINLMGQIRTIGVIQSFNGADQFDNIYIFDSSYYHMVVRISFDGSRSSIDISQKQVFVE
nr:hypothetical protein [uncultured Mucilaginibacter sp.]